MGKRTLKPGDLFLAYRTEHNPMIYLYVCRLSNVLHNRLLYNVTLGTFTVVFNGEDFIKGENVVMVDQSGYLIVADYLGERRTLTPWEYANSIKTECKKSVDGVMDNYKILEVVET